MWKMLWMEQDVMKRQKKGTFLPDLTKCEELSVGSDTLEELQNYLNMG